MIKLQDIVSPKAKWIRFAYLTLSGVLSGLCMAFPSVATAIIEWLVFIPAALVFYACKEDRFKLRNVYLDSFWLIYSQHIIVYHWFISFYPLDFTGMSKPAAAGVVIIAIFGLSLIAAAFGGLFGLATVLVSRTSLAEKYPILLPIIASSAYTLNEWFRTCFWFGVPWGRLPLGQLIDGIPFSVQSASVFGQYFVTFLIVLVSFMIAQGIKFGRLKACTYTACALILVNLIFGIASYYISTGKEACDTLSVAVIQGNVSSREKWDNEFSSLDIHISLTKDAAEEGAELILWPETVLSDLNEYTESIISDICIEYGTNVLFGCFDYDDDRNPLNTLRLIDSSGTLSDTVYLKRHLVPFGEYVPMRSFVEFVFPPLADIGMLSEDLKHGDDSAVFTIEHNGKELNLGGLICFDSIYEELSYSSASDGANILCVATNDSWFEDSRAVYMHCAQSRLRAIETGLPVIRAANTGISAIITPNGEVTDSLGPLLRGYVVGDIEISSAKPCSDVGNRLFISFCVLLLLALPLTDFFNRFCKKRK